MSLFSLTKQQNDGAMPKASITVLRAALCVSLAAITILAVIPLDASSVSGIDDKACHILAFYFLALLVDFSYPETNLNSAKILPLIFYGLSIECVQYGIPYRQFSLWDLAADALGLLIYGLSVPGLKLIPLLRFRWNLTPIDN